MPKKTPGPTEAQWQTEVLRIAKRWGWRSYHTRVSFGSTGGFPDLVMVRGRHGAVGPRLIFAELKSETGTVKPAQQDWLDELTEYGVEVYVWRPSDVEQVVGVLSGLKAKVTP